MSPSAATGARRRHRTPGAVVAALLAVGLLAGCTADTDADPDTTTDAPARASGTAPTPSAPQPEPDAASDVPVASATLPPTRDVVAPTALAIDALGVSLPVEPVGVQADGQMEIPPSADVAGWYRFGAAPGEAEGTVVVAAHVDSVASAGLGPFARLGDLAVGDAVDVTTADGAVVTYAVTGRTSVAKPQVAWADVFTRDGGHRLVLVTCGGVWHEDRRSYSDNVIVTAEPIG